MSSERRSEPRLRGEDKPRDLGLLAPVAAGCDSGRNPGPSTTFLLADALDWLLEQTELVLRTLGATAATPTRYGERDAPAYELLYRRAITNPDC